MVATISTMQDLNSAAPDFALEDVRSSKLIKLSSFKTRPLLLMFICNHCPYVVHVIERLTELANTYQKLGYGVLAINSNDVDAYPQDGPDYMQEFAQQHGFEFAYCFDQSQQVAINYQAACTPDFFVYDRDHQLRYRGQMDGSRPGNSVAVSGADLKAALDAVLNNLTVNEPQVPSMGCNIKWRLGNQPA